MKRRALRDFGWTYGLLAVNKGRGIAVIVILGRAMGLDAIGYYTVGYTASTFATTVGSAGLGSALVLHWPDVPPASRRAVVRSLYRRATVLTASLVTVFSLVVFIEPAVVGAQRERLAVALLACSALPWAWNGVTENAQRAMNRMRAYSAVGILESVLEVGVLLAVVALGGSLVMIASALLAVELTWSAVAFFDADRRVGQVRGQDARNFDVAPLASTGASIAVSTLGAGLVDRADRLIVGGVLGARALGAYAAAYAVASAVYSLVNPAVTVIVPRLRDRWRVEREATAFSFIRRGRLLLAGLGVVGVIVVVVKDRLARIVSDEADVSVISDLIPILVGAAMTYAVAQLALLPSYWDRRVWRVAWCYVGIGVPGLVLSYALLQQWGTRGAAIASGISYAALFVAAVAFEEHRSVRRRIVGEFGAFAVAGMSGVVLGGGRPLVVVAALAVPSSFVVLREARHRIQVGRPT